MGAMMKRLLAILTLISVVSCVYGQFEIGISLAFPREFKDPCNSAAVASGTTNFNIDFIDTLNTGSTTSFPVSNAWTYVSTDAGASWLSPIVMSAIGGTFYPDTWQSSRTNAASGSVMYYFKCETESTLTSECPENNPNTFPLAANKAASIGDPAGDHIGADGRIWNTYDISGFWASYDSDEFFFRVNLAGGWKDNHFVLPFTNYFHVLAIPILNNESPYRDSLFFAVLVCNVNLLVVSASDGLYKFWAEDGDDDPLNNYERIGSVTFTPSDPGDDTDFSVKFPISMLTSNGWGSWPNSSRTVGTGCATLTAWLSGTDPQFVINDVTKSSGVVFNTHNYTIGTNAAPTLAPSHLVTTNRDTSWIDLSCTYTDANGNLPTQRQLTIDRGTPSTTTIGSLDHGYADGSVFTHSATYRCDFIDSLKYKWDFNDGAGVVSTGWRYAVVPSEIGLQLTGASWTVGSDLGSLDTVQMSEANVITITNTGNCSFNLGLQVDSLPNYWQLDTVVNHDTTVIYARFNDSAAPPAFSAFTQNDALSRTLLWANGTRFGAGGLNISYCVDGANTEKLYLAFIVPNTYYADGSQRIKMSLWASNTLP